MFLKSLYQASQSSEDPIECIFERGHKRKKYENFSDSQLEVLNLWFSKVFFIFIYVFFELFK